MEINKILSDSPPHKRRQLSHPSLRQLISRRRPNTSELEVAELMAALSTGCMPSLTEAAPVVCPTVRHHHPPPNLNGTTSGFLHPSTCDLQHQLPLHGTIATTPKKGRRATTTKRLAPSPSGQPCANCGVEASTLWRTCEIHNRSSYLCNACGLRYKKGKFCPICYRVYYDVDTNQLHWKQCQNCMNWTHKHCLQQRGTLTNTPYTCLTCRRKSEDQGNVSSRESGVV